MEIQPTEEEKEAADAWFACHYPDSKLDLMQQKKLVEARVLQLRAEHYLLIRQLLESFEAARRARESKPPNRRDPDQDAKGKQTKRPRERRGG